MANVEVPADAIEVDDARVAVVDEILGREETIKSLRDEQVVLKAQHWLSEVRDVLPFEIVTDKGSVVIERVEQRGGTVTLYGSEEFLGSDFWPWTIANPPLNVDSDGKADALGALTDQVVELGREEKLPAEFQVQTSDAVEIGAVETLER